MRLSNKLADFLLLILALGAYGTSLALPAWLCTDNPLSGLWVLRSGWLGFFMLDPRWLCNLLPVVAVGSFFSKERIIPWWASVLIATLAATTLLGPYWCGGNAGSLGTGSGPGSGQLFWVASMFLFALSDPRGLQRTRHALPVSGSKEHIWVLDAIEKLSLKQLAALCVGYYELKGFSVRKASVSSKDSIAFALHKAGFDKPVAIVQCKIHRREFDSSHISSLRAGMRGSGTDRGVVWLSPGFVADWSADSLGRSGVQVLDAVAIVKRLRMLGIHEQGALWKSLQKVEDRSAIF